MDRISTTNRPILSLKSKLPANLQSKIMDLSEMSARTENPTVGQSTAAQLRTLCFVDAQNLHRDAQRVFGCDQDVDPVELAKRICSSQHWLCEGIYYYMGAPDPNRQPTESLAWNARRAQLEADGVNVFERPVQFIERHYLLPDGSSQPTTKVREKGIDLRMGLDIYELAVDAKFDAALLFSRDQNLNEIVPSIRRLSQRQNRPIVLASAYPRSSSQHLRGIDGTWWLPIDRTTYEACLATTDQLNRPPSGMHSTASG